ncbi:MAG TPA: helix-turn-helix domain-containing protein [Pyrinomonadaceae bacterium]|nr:helix-turn-helix domain-containing protein [Pyrinomonadaceae bacterium]
MDLQTFVFENQADVVVTQNVLPICELARGMEEAGEFDRAAEILQPFWKGLSHRPETEGLSDEAKAELLLRTGTLTGWLGSAKQVSGAQETAKDFISESAAIFEMLGMTEKVAEARVDLSTCYWREGALDEARVTLRHVFDSLGHTQSEQRLRALLNSIIIEKVATRGRDALRICIEAAPLFELSSNHALKGKFHNAHATLLRSLGTAEQREDYIDKALVEYVAASYHFEQAGTTRFQARVENNTGFLFASIGRFSEAQQHLTLARSLHLSVGDHGGAAGAEDSRAQAFLLEGKFDHAERAARSAVRSLKRGGEHALLAEALTTHAKALARLKQGNMAKATLDQAIEIAQTAGSPDAAGIAAVTAIEELNSHLTANALQEYYRTAESLLADSQDRSLQTRLGQCARCVLTVAANEGTSEDSDASVPVSMPPGFSLDSEVLRYEGNLIRRALEDSGGSVTRAARLLGVTHQGLAFILNGRHSDLLSIRTPVKRRRRSIIRYH